MKKGDVILLAGGSLLWVFLVRTGRHDALKGAVGTRPATDPDVEKRALGTFATPRPGPGLFETRGRAMGGLREPRMLTADEARRAGLTIFTPGQVRDTPTDPARTWVPRVLQDYADKLRGKR